MKKPSDILLELGIQLNPSQTIAANTLLFAVKQPDPSASTKIPLNKGRDDGFITVLGRPVPTAAYKSLTEEQLNVVRALDSGMKAEHVARLLGFDGTARVHSIFSSTELRKFGCRIPRRPCRALTAADRAEIVRRCDAGESTLTIAIAVGCSEASVDKTIETVKSSC